MSGVQVLAVPTPQLAAWRPELVLALTALVSLVALLWPRARLELPVLLGLALATGLALNGIPAEPTAPLGPHFLVDGPAALVRLVILSLALVAQMLLRPRDSRAGTMLALAALGCCLLAQAVTLGGLLVAVAITALGSGLAAWYTEGGVRRVAAAQWLATAGLGFGVLAFAGVLWCGMAGTLELTAMASALAARPALPPLALPILITLAGAGLALALLGEPGRFRRDDGDGAPAVLVGWITVAPALAVAVLLQRLLVDVATAPIFAAVPGLMAAMAGVLVVGSFMAAAAQDRLSQRLAWAATGQAGLAMLGFVGSADTAVLTTPVLLLLAMAPAHLGAMILAENLTITAARPRWREPQLMLLVGLLVSLAALPPLAGWRPRLDLIANLQASDQKLGLAVAAVGTLLAFVVYLRPLVDLWQATPEESAPAAADADARSAAWAPVLPTLIATALLAGVVAWGLGLVDPTAVLP